MIDGDPQESRSALRFDVDDEDVEYLLAEFDRMRAAFEATLATLRGQQQDAREHEARGNLTVASIAVENAINSLRGEFLKGPRR